MPGRKVHCAKSRLMDVVVFFPEFADQEGAQGREG
jgi:hypothetical protein